MSNLSLHHNCFTPLSFSSFVRIASVVVPLTLITACSTYQNVTGYFNTYYNAKKLFDDAVTEVEGSPQRTRDTVYFVGDSSNPSSDAKFDKVIEKCSKIIQFYDKSSWIDDAILMIG